MEMFFFEKVNLVRQLLEINMEHVYLDRLFLFKALRVFHL